VRDALRKHHDPRERVSGYSSQFSRTMPILCDFNAWQFYTGQSRTSKKKMLRKNNHSR